MSPPAHTDDASSLQGEVADPGSRGVRARLAAVRGRVQSSWVGDVGARLNALDVVNTIVVFGATLLLSVLPLLILLSSLADRRIDGDLSRHIGLNSHGARIVSGLFRTAPAHSAGAIATGLIIAFAGTLAVVSSLQVIYERVFELDHRGWRDLPRFIVWVVALAGLLILDGVISGPVRSAGGAVGRGLLTFVELTLFFWWTAHFLLDGRVSWHGLARPAFLTALLWLGLALFSSLYFSSSLVSDSRLYGTIGVVFTLLTWMIAIGAVVVLGAVGGAVWEQRRGRERPAAAQSSPAGETPSRST